MAAGISGAWHRLFTVWRVLQILVVIATLVLTSLYAAPDILNVRVIAFCTIALCIAVFFYLITTLALHLVSRLSYGICAISEVVQMLLYAGDIVLYILWTPYSERGYEKSIGGGQGETGFLAFVLMIGGGGLALMNIAWSVILWRQTPKPPVLSDEEAEEFKPVVETPTLEEVLREEGFGDSVARAWRMGTSVRSEFFGEARRSKGSLGGMI